MIVLLAPVDVLEAPVLENYHRDLSTNLLPGVEKRSEFTRQVFLAKYFLPCAQPPAKKVIGFCSSDLPPKS